MKKLILFSLISACFYLFLFEANAYTDYPAASGATWKMGGGLTSYTGDHVSTTCLNGDCTLLTITCNPSDVCCWEVLSDGQILRVYDMNVPPDPNSSSTLFWQE